MSLQMRAVSAYLRLTSKPRMATAERTRRLMAEPKRPAEPPRRLRDRHVVSSREVGGFACHTVSPRGGAARAAVYVHGGAYISDMAPQHWALVSRLADAGVRVEVPSYGLAPQHTHREAHPLLAAVYRELLADVDPSTVVLAGDSAGAGLVLGFAQTLGQAGLPAPRRLVLISPWLDLTLSNPDVRAVQARDPWLSPDGLIEAGRAWAGGDDPRDPRLSPVNGPLAGLPPTDVLIGTRDLFHPDVLRLQQRAIAEAAPVRVTVCPGAVHVYPLTPTPEGRAAAAAIVDTVARGQG